LVFEISFVCEVFPSKYLYLCLFFNPQPLIELKIKLHTVGLTYSSDEGHKKRIQILVWKLL